MSLHWQDWLIVLLVPLIAFALGYKGRSQPKNYLDYFLARRNLGGGRFLAAFFGSNLVFTAIFLVISSETAQRGWIALSIPLSFFLGVILLACLYPKLTFYFDQGQTLHQALGSAFEKNSSVRSSIRRWTAIWTIISFVGLVGIEFYGGILLLKWSGVPLLNNFAVSTLLALICTGFTAAGGLRGVARADIWLDVISLLGIGIFLSALIHVGALTSISIGSHATLSNSVSSPDLSDNIIFCLVALILFVPMPICALDTWQRGVAWKERSQVSGFLIGGAVGIVAVSIISMLVGFYARTHGWTVGDPYPFRMVLEPLHLPVYWTGLVVGGFIAAILSTADELLNCCAYAWMVDVRQLSPETPSRTSDYLRAAKLYTSLFGFLAAFLAILCALAEEYSTIRIPDIFNVVASAQVVFFVPLLVALYGRGIAPRYHTTVKFSMGLAFLTALSSALCGAFLIKGETGQALIDSGPLLALITSLAVMTFGWIINRFRK